LRFNSYSVSLPAFNFLPLVVYPVGVTTYWCYFSWIIVYNYVTIYGIITKFNTMMCTYTDLLWGHSIWIQQKNPDPFWFLQKLAQMLMVLRNFGVPNFGSFHLPPCELWSLVYFGTFLHLFTKMLISYFVNNIETFCLFYWILH